ncbi:MAG: sulfatase [Pseudomonadota bacterium]
MKKRMWKTYLTALIFLVFFAEGRAISAETPPVGVDKDSFNVVLITINVLRADHVSCYGYDRKTTPAIDALAENASVFKNAFTQAGYTFPNMISILTSVYPDSHKVYLAFKDKLSPNVKTLPELLRIFGYQTAWFAVLEDPHLALDAGFGRGFDFKKVVDMQLNGKEAIPEWIEQHKEKPFFVAMNLRHTHVPYFPLDKYRSAFKSGEKGPLIEDYQQLERKVYAIIVKGIEESDPEFTGLFAQDVIEKNKDIFDGSYNPEKFSLMEDQIILDQRHKLGSLMMKNYNESVNTSSKDNLDYFISLYDACILGTDQEVVQPVIDVLKKEKLFDKTLIIVTGDHGEAHGEHGVLGHGTQFYEQQIHVPLVVKLPGQSAKKEFEDMVQSIDIMPTILDVAGVEKPYYIHGKSLMPIIDGKDESTEREYVYGENYERCYIRSRQWKLIMKRKELQEGSSLSDMLFHLADDPNELSNAKEQFPLVHKELRAKLKKHLVSLPDFTDKKYQFAPNIDSTTQERIKKTGYW